MEQIFVSRASAIARLLNRKRDLLSEVEFNPSLTAAVDDIEWLLLQVRSGRMHMFDFTDSTGQLCRIYIL